MMKRAAVLASLPFLTAVTAHADDSVTTQTAGTVVVVTPSAPIVAVTGASPVARAAAVAGPSMVAPQAPASADAPPHNEDWSNVSHINGQVVKVGERQDYLIKFKKSNIAVNPFGVFWNYWDGSYSYGATENIALSGAISIYSKGDNDYSSTMFQFTASAPIYLRRTFSGPFVEPGLIYRSTSHNDSYAYDTTCSGCSSSNSQSWVGPEMLFGWHWTYDSGLNVVVAGGVAKHMSDSNTSTSSDKVDGNGYFRIGYNF